MMIDNIANGFLAFSHDTIIIPLVILGYIWLDKKVFYSAICLVLFNMIFSAALKATFQVPLAPSIGKAGFAFPSGHMQSAFVLYGWLMSKTHKMFIRLIMLVILAGIAVSLVHFGFHNYYDILGAIFFGGILLLIYQKLLSKYEFSLSWSIFFSSTIMIVYIAYVYRIESHLWMAYYGLIGIMFSEKTFSNLKDSNQSFLNNKKPTTKNVISKIVATIFCFGAFFLIKIVFASECMSDLPGVVSQLQWALISFCIPLSRVVMNFVAKKRLLSA